MHILPRSPLLRLQLNTVKLLGWSNGLESWLAFAAVVYALPVMLAPDWIDHFGRHIGWLLGPPAFAPLLFLTGGLSLISQGRGWRHLRRWTSGIAFTAWAMLAVYDTRIPIYQLCALHALLALGELAVYARIRVGLDPTPTSPLSRLYRGD